MNEREVYHIRDYRPGDETAITELFGQAFGAPLTVAQWRWKYIDAGLETPLATLAFDPAGRLVGHAGAIPLRGWRQNRPLPCFQVCDVMVHPAARGQLGGRNLFTRLARELLGNLAERWPDAFAYGFPGQRPFRLGEYARVYGRIERAPAVRRLAQRGGFPLLYTRPLAWDDSRLDALWARLAPNFALALIRDRAYLVWRYATHPLHTYELIGLHLAGRLLGWAVTRRDDDRLRVIDLLLPRRWLKPALAALDRAALAVDATEIEIWLPRGWREAGGGQQELTEIVVANMVWRLPIPTHEVSGSLYYTMGDLDIF
ncbi:MAG: GNAT family N-acetyltransferase [Candidatus Contendobacter sp.]